MTAGRRCPAPSCPRIIPADTRYCPAHTRDYEARRGTPQDRGYDTQHRALRARWQSHIDAGELVCCARCGTRITGTTWDLGHTDDRTRYRGPECQPCNRSAGGRNGARAAQHARRDT